MFKQLFSVTALALALSVGASSTSLAQTKTKSDDEKTKVKDAEMTTKTKVADDGKMKVKGEAADGSKMKATTKPRKGADMKNMQMSEMAPDAGAGVMVGGAMMTPDKDIVDNAVGSSDHTTLVAAVKAGGLVETLKGTGPFTVFAPTNAAFNKLPAGTVNTLVMPENKQKLATILTYHVVPGRLMAADLKDGQTLTTVEGETLMVHRKGNTVMLHDAKGGSANVTIPNVVSSNGVTHVIDGVLMPTK
ncbi:Uncaracterized surface protein containing fasciclin (FAS1) repeats [Hymenobacter psychrotolerans DSM 18569]|uniref:Uncaracterized surface protein containing fasciclin (FAS1) repeats n=2 Tax=Hymenobacter psychrotolerans TaxID=344998 RepID=A0A1M6W084_9BACT|nr:Uncaracterized surface protein containing fasciclin (FAS1) repeats [Hymenobacter psychrotolerans DSM 18569]